MSGCSVQVSLVSEHELQGAWGSVGAIPGLQSTAQ